MYKFSDAVLRSLHIAGWSERYRYDSTDIEQRLTSHGHMVSPAIKRFLQDFGGLKMKCNCRYRSNSPDEVDFYIYEMDAILARNSVTEVQEQMQITICPIRRCSDRDMLLYMDADGKLYANEDGYICFVGKDVPEAFDNLVVGKELEELYEQE